MTIRERVEALRPLMENAKPTGHEHPTDISDRHCKACNLQAVHERKFEKGSAALLRALLAEPSSLPEAPQVPLREAQMTLERDRSQVAECVTAVKKALHNYDWLITSRGSYEWNDDRWHEEFKRASENIWEAIQPMVKIAADWSNCPKSADDIQTARELGAASPKGTQEKADE